MATAAANAAGSVRTASRRVWVYGINDCNVADVAERAKDFSASGSFRRDFKALCEHCGLVAHPALVPVRMNAASGDATDDRGGEMLAEGALLAIQSELLDRAALEIARLIIPTSLHLSVIRISACQLDCEMLRMLRTGLNDTCTVHTLHLDWNPLEVPLDGDRARETLANGSVEDLAELERQREQHQAERTLKSFFEVLLLRAKDLAAAVPAAAGDTESFAEDEATPGLPRLLGPIWRRVSEAAVPDYPGTAMLEPLNVTAWIRAFKEELQFPPRETERIFELLDGSPFGPGDGLVPLARLECALERLARDPSFKKPAERAIEANDPLGRAFAAFIDATSVLEVVSFRCCNIGRLEMVPICDAMRTSRHLKALNLWGNRLCDATCVLLADALRGSAPYYGLVYLGLGQNFVTHGGLETLCKKIGLRRVTEKKEADSLQKEINSATKERDKLIKKPEPPKLDASGRERYKADFLIDSCEEKRDPGTGQVHWLHFRNVALKTLNLEDNPVSDATVVLRIQPFGVGDLVLRKCPCVAELLAAAQAARAAAEEGAEDEAAAAAARGPTPPGSAAAPSRAATARWNLVL